jgi:hypothetical protein
MWIVEAQKQTDPDAGPEHCKNFLGFTQLNVLYEFSV